MAESDIIIEVNGKPTNNSAGGFLDTITDLNFGLPGGIVTVSMSAPSSVDADITIIEKGVTILSNTTTMYPRPDVWWVYYPRQTSNSFTSDGSGGWIPVPYLAGYDGFQNALNGLATDGVYPFTNGFGGRSWVFSAATYTTNYHVPGPDNWSDWPGGGSSSAFTAATAAAYSAFLNAGYPGTSDTNTPQAYSTTGSEPQDPIQTRVIKIKVPHAAKTLAAANPAFSISSSIRNGGSIKPLNPKKPVDVQSYRDGDVTTYYVYKQPANPG